jgi:tRNA-splicing ligase RtcB
MAVRKAARRGTPKASIRDLLRAVIDRPAAFEADEVFGDLAKVLTVAGAGGAAARYAPRETPAPFRQWGDDLEPQSVQQMVNACELPIAVRGALMPDAHLGYGLPIGGVLATDNTVIPYAVGVDIACRMKMTVLDLPTHAVDDRTGQLEKAIYKETRFGLGASFERPRKHDVMDEDWSVTPVTAHVKDKAWRQLGSSGTGNHFVEFGVLRVDDGSVGLDPGEYLALLSHSGSRGAGATVAGHFSKLAMKQHPELPKQLRHLAWLDLDTADGRAYWQAMELMGKYAAANHACIHKHIARHLGAQVLLDLENHHNFAWREQHDGRSLIVHRKGATPAAAGDIGIIPGSMASPTYVVRGKGNRDALNSAAHGAGRVMSRRKAKQTYRWKEVNQYLDERRVKLLSAGLDEVPMVYKDIDQVMAAQSDLVETLACFTPRLVKMAPAGERAED